MTKIKESKTTGEEVFLDCPRCKVNTKHAVERAVEWSGFDEEDCVHYWEVAQIIRCNGCDNLSFRLLEGDSMNTDHHGDPIESQKLYPERVNRSLADELYLRHDVYDIPPIIQTVYRETLSAVQHDLSTLAGIGIRAIIEATCQDLKAKKGNLEKKIDQLVSMALLTPAGAEILHGIRLLGNEAAHEMKAPKKGQIIAALKVIDHLLLGVYVLPQEASSLPKRKPKASGKATKKSSKSSAKKTSRSKA